MANSTLSATPTHGTLAASSVEVSRPVTLKMSGVDLRRPGTPSKKQGPCCACPGVGLDIPEGRPWPSQTDIFFGGDITVDRRRCFLAIASIHSEQHGHVKARFLRQWRPVLSRCGMRGVRVGEASNPGPENPQSSLILATQVDRGRA